MKIVMNLVRVGLIVALSMALMLPTGCGSDDGNSGDSSDEGTTDEGTTDKGTTDEGTTSGEAIEVMGSWDDNYGGHAEISETMWGDYAIIEFDNANNWAITQNSENSDWDPGLYSKLVWIEAGEDASWYYCVVDYGKDTAEAAQNTEKTADDSDPANTGCGGFSWTKMVSAAEVLPSDG